MTTSLALSNSPIPPLANITLLADNPADMVGAQKSLILWCEQKIATCDAERIEATANAARAIASGWAGEGKRWRRVAGRQRHKIIFYDKIRLALNAGYYIVPPFPGQVFAIRTEEDAQPSSSRSYHSRTGSTDHEQGPQILPAGEGVYRNPFPQIENFEDHHKGPDGKEIVTRWSESIRFLPMEFPIALAKTQILDAANRAMALKIFDKLTILPKTRSPDPIVMGEIIDAGDRYGKSVSFFVAWWLDTRTL